jgi:hypothetical protein
VKRQEDEMPKKRESRANDFTPLPFEIDSQVDDALLTAHAGVPLAIELFRASGSAGVVDEEVRLKERARGLSASQMVESLMALWLAGGERCEDLQRLREDEALSQLLGGVCVAVGQRGPAGPPVPPAHQNPHPPNGLKRRLRGPRLD